MKPVLILVFMLSSLPAYSQLPVTDNLRLHFAADSISGLSGGQRVSVWNDLSGRGNNATASGNPIYRAEGLKGKPAVEFIESNGGDYFTLGNISSEFPNGAALFIVAEINNDEDYNLFSTRNNGCWWRWNNNGQSYPGMFRTTRIESYCSMPDSGTGIFEVTSSNNSWEMFLNGKSQGASSPSYNAGDGNCRIGSAKDVASNLNGIIAEIVIYNGVLTDDQRNQVGSYLGSKYRIGTAYEGEAASLNWPREKLVEWTYESLAQVEKDHRIIDTYYYYENQDRSAQSFTWGLGMEMRALAQAAKIDPYRYTARLENLANAVRSEYWDPDTNGIGGFSVTPATSSQYDRYTDENAWLSYSYAKTYQITNNPDHLQWAKESLAFVLSLENTTYSDENITLGGIWWKEAFNIWCPQIAACSTAAAALAALEIYSITGESYYLNEGIELLDWLTDNMQDSDDLFWDTYHTVECSDSFGSHEVGIRGWKWSVDSAKPMHVFALLYELTGDPAYLAKAEKIAAALENKWVDAFTGTINDASCFGFTVIEGWLALYRQTGNTHWLDLTASALDFVHKYTRDENGRYPEFWNQTPSSPYTAWQLHWTTAQPCAYATAAALYGKTVVPEIQIDSANITASASSTEWGSADNTVNGSGLNNFNHSNYFADMWISAVATGGSSNPHPGTESGAAWLKYEFDQSYPLGTMWIWNDNHSSGSVCGLRWITIEYTNDRMGFRASYKRKKGH